MLLRVSSAFWIIRNKNCISVSFRCWEITFKRVYTSIWDTLYFIMVPINYEYYYFYYCYLSAVKWDRNVFCCGWFRRYSKSVATRSSSFMCLNKHGGEIIIPWSKWLLKCYWKMEKVAEVQRRWKVEFGTPAPKRVTTTRIRDKFEIDGTMKDVLKGRCRK